jgi:hypothetical protein
MASVFAFYTSFYTRSKKWGLVESKWAPVETSEVPAEEWFVRISPSGDKMSPRDQIYLRTRRSTN